MTAPLLQLDDLTVRYGGVTALRGLNLVVRQGELVTLLGSNGAGKSTTLRAISQLVPAAAGTLRWNGGVINGLRTERTVKLGIAHCPEGRRVLARQSVADNLELGAWLRRDRNAIRHDLDRCYGLFPRLAERRSQAAGSLSGGEQQMLAIARSLMSRPRLVMFDEPSLGLAPNFVEAIFQLVSDIRSDGATVLMVEQNAYAALEMCDRSYLLETGSIVASGSAAEMLANSDIRKAYLGG